LYQELITNRNV